MARPRGAASSGRGSKSHGRASKSPAPVRSKLRGSKSVTFDLAAMQGVTKEVTRSGPPGEDASLGWGEVEAATGPELENLLDLEERIWYRLLTEQERIDRMNKRASAERLKIEKREKQAQLKINMQKEEVKQQVAVFGEGGPWCSSAQSYPEPPARSRIRAAWASVGYDHLPLMAQAEDGSYAPSKAPPTMKSELRPPPPRSEAPTAVETTAPTRPVTALETQQALASLNATIAAQQTVNDRTFSQITDMVNQQTAAIAELNSRPLRLGDDDIQRMALVAQGLAAIVQPGALLAPLPEEPPSGSPDRGPGHAAYVESLLVEGGEQPEAGGSKGDWASQDVSQDESLVEKLQGFVRSLLEPCLWLKRDCLSALEGFVLIEVDDLAVSGRLAFQDTFKKRATARFKFGKWQSGEADYAGRHLRQSKDRIFVDQEKYIREQLTVMPHERVRRASPDSLLTQSEIASYRAVIAQVRWVARESRPDVAGGASILAGAMPSPTVRDAMTLMKICKFLKAPAAQTLTIWALDSLPLTCATASDAGGPGSAHRGGAQGAWLAMAADASIRANKRARVSVLSWESQRLKRVLSSTVAAETLALSGAVAEAQWLQDRAQAGPASAG
ncbi:unnamed protein product, partial [Prorocentrum cordatum]